MALFQTSFTDTNGDSTITIDCTTSLVTITDSSNYVGNDSGAGFDVTDFATYRKIIVTKSNGETYTYSSLGDGDEAMLAASSLNNTVTYTIDETSEILTVALITIPDYNADGTTDGTYGVGALVYYGGVIYASLTAANPSLPTDTDDWVVVADTAEAISAYTTYYIEGKISSYCQMFSCRDSLTNDAFCASEDCGCCGTCNLCENKNFLKSVEMEVLIRAYQIASINNDWDRIQCIFNRANQLCC